MRPILPPTAGAVAVSAVTATGSEKEAQSWKLLLPQKFNKQVFDGRRNDPRDVPRMPLRQRLRREHERQAGTDHPSH